MRQSAQQVEPSPAWKEEVNRRVALHQGRKGRAALSEISSAGSKANAASDSKSIARPSNAAAARVAARYAKAPSYSEMFARDARVAMGVVAAPVVEAPVVQAVPVEVPRIEKAPKAQSGFETRAVPVFDPRFDEAFKRERAADLAATGEDRSAVNGTAPSADRPQSQQAAVLAAIPAAQIPVAAEPARTHTERTEAQRTADRPPAKPTISQRPFEIRWDADLPQREDATVVTRAFRGNSIYEVDAEAIARMNRGEREALEMAELDVIEPGQPIPANLIHFPRELVAAQKARPRRAEGGSHVALEPEPLDHGPSNQISSNQIASMRISSSQVASSQVSSSQPGPNQVAPNQASFSVGQSSKTQLSIFEAEPSAVKAAIASAPPETTKTATKVISPAWNDSSVHLGEQPAWQASSQWTANAHAGSVRTPAVQVSRVAPLSRRILGALVDFSLVSLAFLAAAILGLTNATVIPPLREFELVSLGALALTAVFYQALFFGLSTSTPGMQYAGLELCTFAGRRPALQQRIVRSAALIVSLLPLGLGAAWALFDEQELTWHDRLSGTYLRQL